MNITSPSFPKGAQCRELEDVMEVRAIRARREAMEDAMRAEGTSESMIARLATDDTAERMLAYERRTVDFIANLFGGGQ